MTAPDAQLPIEGANLYGKPRRVEAALRAAVEAADLDDVDAGGGALAVELARAVDVASGRQDPYGVAAAARELREQLTRLGMDPASRKDGTPNGGVNWLDMLGPTVDDAARDPAPPVRNP